MEISKRWHAANEFDLEFMVEAQEIIARILSSDHSPRWMFIPAEVREKIVAQTIWDAYADNTTACSAALDSVVSHEPQARDAVCLERWEIAAYTFSANLAKFEKAFCFPQLELGLKSLCTHLLKEAEKMSYQAKHNDWKILTEQATRLRLHLADRGPQPLNNDEMVATEYGNLIEHYKLICLGKVMVKIEELCMAEEDRPAANFGWGPGDARRTQLRCDFEEFSHPMWKEFTKRAW